MKYVIYDTNAEMFIHTRRMGDILELTWARDFVPRGTRVFTAKEVIKVFEELNQEDISDIQVVPIELNPVTLEFDDGCEILYTEAKSLTQFVQMQEVLKLGKIIVNKFSGSV